MTRTRGRVTIFGAALDPSAPATPTRACLRRYLLRAVFSPAKTVSRFRLSPCNRGAVLPLRASRPGRRGVASPARALCPFGRPLFFRGTSTLAFALDYLSVNILARPRASYYIRTVGRFARSVSPPGRTRSVRSFARARDGRSQHSLARREPGLTRGATSPSVLYE